MNWAMDAINVVPTHIPIIWLNRIIASGIGATRRQRFGAATFTPSTPRTRSIGPYQTSLP